jgi:hypothetical protein
MACGIMAVLLAAGGGFGFTGGAANAADGALGISSTALTSAPPAEPQSVFNPNHLYLDNGTNSISATTGSVTVSGSTSATQVVDTIGVTFYVQKWNGSSWETFGTGTTTSGTQLAYYTNQVVKTVTAGYYYRARTIHWITKNGVYEEGERFSNTVLGQ